MNRTQSAVAGLAVAVSLAFATATFAQPGGGMGGGYGPGTGMGHGMGHGPMSAADRAAMVDQHLALLKAALKLNTGQEAAWQIYAGKVKQQAATMQALHAQAPAVAATAPERMAQQTAMMQQRAAGMAAMTTALADFYAVLTPEQKAVADQNIGMMGRHGGGRGPKAG